MSYYCAAEVTWAEATMTTIPEPTGCRAAEVALLVAAPSLDRIKWVKDPGLESGFNPVLDRIQYLAENGLTSLTMLHDFLLKHLTPLKDRPCPAWMYTGVNDIMRLDHGPGSSLDDVLLAVSLKALTRDQFSTEFVVPPAICEPICMNRCKEVTSPVMW
jgi:hypothetical protein